ncbi:ribosome maturation protein [Diplogelasinospora grovesii]|uniref:Ribosome maturation protein n=1 Tax=Diplogelasinospora grovesii TaxID=303347 RepID=A0AAN6N973_9PEZI|nr:ribosome maturation protein [Diplogelasinospora grovesii]
MVRGEAAQIKVHYKGKDDDFLVFLDSVEDYKKWLSDKSIPLAQVVSAFKIFVTHKQGAQGVYDGASKSALENEFGTSNEDDAIKQILEKGTLQESTMPDRQGSRNDTEGPMTIAR